MNCDQISMLYFWRKKNIFFENCRAIADFSPTFPAIAFFCKLHYAQKIFQVHVFFEKSNKKFKPDFFHLNFVINNK